MKLTLAGCPIFLRSPQRGNNFCHRSALRIIGTDPLLPARLAESQLRSPPACNGTEQCKRRCRTLCLLAPRLPLSAAAGSMPRDASRSVSARDRMLVTTFRSPATVSAFTDPIPGSKFLACHFASSPANSSARSALLLCYRPRFAPVAAASLLLARCGFPGLLCRLRCQPPLLFGAITPLRIDAFSWFCRRSVRLPNPPDFLSLPAAVFYY